MNEELPTHEQIERAFKPAHEAMSRLPESMATKRAKVNLDVAEDYLHEARDRAKCREPQESEAS